MQTELRSMDLVVFSHLRWDFVFQRPQHLMTRSARARRVFFFEEPHYGPINKAHLYMKDSGDVRVAIPYLPEGTSAEEQAVLLRELLDEMIEDEGIRNFTSWYYTPMALAFTRHLTPAAVIYDCMDELSLFKGAPSALLRYEDELFKRADVIFTGGYSLWEAKRHRHPRVHAFPSSINFGHFARAREAQTCPEDQLCIPGPRLGFFGVLDERFDTELLRSMAALRSHWNFVMIGPVVKIDPMALPQAANIHYLGQKDYADLPSYLAGWDVAMMPFALNESTRFISPTKTPEYLAAGRPVVSTPIRDVVRSYGDAGIVHIAETPEEFVRCAEQAMKEGASNPSWLSRVDSYLADKSWDETWRSMMKHEIAVRRAKGKRDASERENWIEIASL